MNYIFKVLILTLVVAACSKEKTTADKTGEGKLPDNRPELRVMTYNIHHCNPPAKAGVIDVAAIAKVINEAGVDLVALQEVDVFTERSGKTLDQAKELGHLTNMHYFFAKAINTGGGEYGVAILSKYPILESQQISLPMKSGFPGEQRVLAWVTIELQNNKKIIFASTHLDTKDHRLVQAEKITEVFRDKPYPVILGGDFNDGPGSEPINHLDQHFSRTCKHSCFNTAPADFPTKAIDLLFYKSLNSFEVVKNYAVLQKTASDHLPLVAHLKVN